MRQGQGIFFATFWFALGCNPSGVQEHVEIERRNLPSEVHRKQVAEAAFGQFAIARGLASDPPHYLATPTSVAIGGLSIDSLGIPRGVWAFAKQGLGYTSSNHAQYAVAFVKAHPGLWGLSKAEIEAIVLTETENQGSATPNGQQVTTVAFDQVVGGEAVLDAGLRAIYWDGVLASVSGMLVLPEDVPHMTARLKQSDLNAIVHSKLPSLGLDGYEVSLLREGVWSKVGRVSEYRAVKAADDRIVSVRATDGHVLDIQALSKEYPATSVNYKVYAPTATSSSSRDPNPVDTLGLGSLYAGSYYFSWVDELANRSPVPVYNEGIDWSGVLGFPWGSFANFLANPGSVDFHSQHASYWTQEAVHTADENFTWWPPANPAYKHAGVTVIANCAGNTRFGNAGCWPHYDLWRDSDEDNGCICAAPSAGMYNDNATDLDTLFHEVGHAIDSKYLSGGARTSSPGTYCDPNTSDEARSLAEAIATIYGQMMMMSSFGVATNFTDYDAISNSLVGLGTNLGEAVVHQDDNSIICHAPHNACGGSAPCETWRPINSPPTLPAPCDSGDANDKYRYGLPLLQAYWEIAHGLNCGSSPCYVFSDGSDYNDARSALFHAMKNSPASATYWDFVYHLLSYYYYSVGTTEWNNRWWVFNHHRLVGPDYGYSPCHTY